MSDSPKLSPGLQALNDLLDKIHVEHKAKVGGERNFKERAELVERLVKEFYTDPKLLEVAGEKVKQIVSDLRGFRISPLEAPTSS